MFDEIIQVFKDSVIRIDELEKENQDLKEENRQLQLNKKFWEKKAKALIKERGD